MTPSDDPPGEATAHSQSYYNDIDNNIGMVDIDNDRPLICSNPSSYASPPRPSSQHSRGSEGGDDSLVSNDDDGSASLGSHSRERGSLGEGGSRDANAIGSLDTREGEEVLSSSSSSSIDNSEHYEHLSTSALSSDSSSLETRPAKEEQGGNKSEAVHRQDPYYDEGCVEEEEEEAAGVDYDQQPHSHTHTPSYQQQSRYQQRQQRETLKANNLTPPYYNQQHQHQHSTSGVGHTHNLHSNHGQNLHNHHHHDDPLRSSATSGTPSYASTNHSSTPSYHQHHNNLTTPPPPSMPYTNSGTPSYASTNHSSTPSYHHLHHNLTTPPPNPNTQFNRQESTFTSYAARHAQHYADPVESVTGTTRDDGDDETNTNASNYFVGDENNSLYTQAYPESFVTNQPPPKEDQELGGGGGILPYPNARGTHGGGYYGDSTRGHNHQAVDNNAPLSTGGSNRNRAMEGIAQHLHLVSLDGSSQQDHHQEHHQQQFHQMLVKYHHSSLGSGQTEGLTDEFGEDDDEGGEEEYGDDDVEEERYRQLPPPRYTRPPTVQEHALVVVQRGLDPEECTSPTDHRALALRRRDDDESINLSNTANHIHHYHPPKQNDATLKNNNNQQQVAIIKTSKEVVADIKHQLSLHDPITSQHHHQLRDPTSSKYTGYQHCFITVKTQHRFLMLYTFLKRNALHNKIILFFSTTKSTQYYAKLLSRLKFQNVRTIHNGQSKETYLEELFAFSSSKKENGSGILCVPDFQGRDLAIPPSCSWLVQFEPCSDPSEYIFRVGRISSENKKTTNKNHHSNNTGSSGTKQSPTSEVVCRALLFLTPEQFAFLEYYKATKVKFYEYEIPKISKVQKELIKLVKNDGRLRKLGSEAYHAYLMAYASHEYRDIYNVHELDSNKVALSFGFEKPPSKVDEDKRSFQETITKREQVRWKPSKKNAEKKKDGNSWMGGTKKSWRYADVHAERMRGSGQNTIAPIGKNVKVPQKNPKK